MSDQTNGCHCGKPVTDVPLRGLIMQLDPESLTPIPPEEESGCTCGTVGVAVPVHGLSLDVDVSALGGAGGGLSGEEVARMIREALQGFQSQGLPGEIRLMPFRNGDLPGGWYCCDGTRYAAGSAQALALEALPETYREDWAITATDEGVNVPHLYHSDGRGCFLRPVDGSARQPGNVELDQFQSHALMLATTLGHLVSTGGTGSRVAGTSAGFSSAATNPAVLAKTFVAGSAGTPRVGTETRPLNIGMTPAVFLGV